MGVYIEGCKLWEDSLDREHLVNYACYLPLQENGYQALLSSDDQLFIYETAGVLIVNSEYSAERKQVLMRNLLTPLMEKFKVLLEKLMMAQDEDRQMALADCLNHAVGFAR